MQVLMKFLRIFCDGAAYFHAAGIAAKGKSRCFQVPFGSKRIHLGIEKIFYNFKFI